MTCTTHLRWHISRYPPGDMLLHRQYPSLYPVTRAVDLIDGLLSDFDLSTQWKVWSNVDFDEKSQAYTVTLDLPGFRREDLTIESEGTTVTVAAKNAKRGTFSRSYSVEGIDPERIAAKLEAGVLELTIPLKISAQKRRVEVT